MKSHRWSLYLFMYLGMLVFVGGLIVGGGRYVYLQMNQHNQWLDDCMEVVNDIHAGLLKPDSKGEYTIPDNYNYKSPTGKIYTVEGQNKEKGLFFPTNKDEYEVSVDTHTSKFIQLAGYIYTKNVQIPPGAWFTFTDQKPSIKEIKVWDMSSSELHQGVWTYAEPVYSD